LADVGIRYLHVTIGYLLLGTDQVFDHYV
jgi:hypothetical protein